jgi:hypothetical protein
VAAVSTVHLPDSPVSEYSSGHSNFSAAGAEILRLFTGRDNFGASVKISAGSSKVEPGRLQQLSLPIGDQFD